MIYNANSPEPGIEVQFEKSEVETIRRVFEENAKRLTALGNDGSISAYEKLIALWTGDSQTYRAPSRRQLLDPIRNFVELTEEKVDEILDTHSQETRFIAAGERYEFGHNADVILKEIEQHGTGEAVGSVD